MVCLAIAAAAVYSNLKPSAKDLVHDVHKYMEEVLWTLVEDVANSFPRLKAAMKALVGFSPTKGISFSSGFWIVASKAACRQAHIVHQLAGNSLGNCLAGCMQTRIP